MRDQVGDVDPGGSADRLRPVDQPDLLVLDDEQIAGADVAVQRRVPVRRRQPAGFQPGQAGEIAAGPGVQAGRRISGQFAPAVDQPGQFAGGGRQRWCSPGQSAIRAGHGTNVSRSGGCSEQRVVELADVRLEWPAAVHGRRDPQTRDPQRDRQSALGAPAGARRTGQARPSDRGLHGLAVQVPPAPGRRAMTFAPMPVDADARILRAEYVGKSASVGPAGEERRGAGPHAPRKTGARP